jgi:hypothetical protein
MATDAVYQVFGERLGCRLRKRGSTDYPINFGSTKTLNWVAKPQTDSWDTYSSRPTGYLQLPSSYLTLLGRIAPGG